MSSFDGGLSFVSKHLLLLQIILCANFWINYDIYLIFYCIECLRLAICASYWTYRKVGNSKSLQGQKLVVKIFVKVGIQQVVFMCYLFKPNSLGSGCQTGGWLRYKILLHI